MPYKHTISSERLQSQIWSNCNAEFGLRFVYLQQHDSPVETGMQGFFHLRDLLEYGGINPCTHDILGSLFKACTGFQDAHMAPKDRHPCVVLNDALQRHFLRDNVICLHLLQCLSLGQAHRLEVSFPLVKCPIVPIGRNSTYGMCNCSVHSAS